MSTDSAKQAGPPTKPDGASLPGRRTTMLISAGLFAFTLALYLITFSPLGAGDGPGWLYHAMSGELRRMFRLERLSHTFLLYVYLQVVRIGSPLSLAMQDPFALTRVVQIPFALAAAAGVALFFNLVVRLTGRLSTAALASFLMIFSYGYWLDANMETKAYTLFFWMLTFWLCMGYAHGERHRLPLIAVATVVTVLCQIDGIVLSLVVLYFIVAKNRGNLKQGTRDLGLTGAISLGLFAVALWLISVQMPGLHEWAFELSGGRFFAAFPKMADDFRVFTRNPLKGLFFSLAAGQCEALVTGYMLIKRIFLDADFAPADYFRLLLYILTVSLVAFYIIFGLVSAWKRQGLGKNPTAHGALMVWFVGYHLLTWWNQPIVSEFRVLTLPPLLVAISLGMGYHSRSASWRRRVIPVIFVLLLAVNNWVLGIHPAWIYGESVRDTYRYLRQKANPQDVFLISEWSVPFPPQVSEENAWSPGAFASAAEGRTTAEVIASLRTSVGGALADGQRVFVYGLIPGRYTLRNMNRFRADDDLFGAAQFERLQAELMASYAWHAVFSVVDARNQATYQLGRRWATLWAICPDAWPDCWQDAMR